MEQNTRPSYYDLFRAFFWLGLTAFGGLAMTANIHKNIVDKKHWIDENTFDTGLALCQIIPGSIGMQLVSYIGLKLKGVRGSIVCFVSFGIPAFLIIFILSVLYKHLANIEPVEVVLKGLRIIIVAIVANATYLFAKKNFSNINDFLIAFIASVLFFIKLHPVLVLIIACLLGIALTKKEFRESSVSVRSKTLRYFLMVLFSIIVSAVIIFMVNRKYFVLATIMLRIDLFAFGGGLAAMPIMYHELVDLYSWFNEKTFMDGIILGQVTPGSIIIAATFYGYMHFGVLGSILATIFVFTPSYLILMGIIPFFDKLKSYPQFNKVINGILCSFVGLLAIVTYRFALDVTWNVFNIVITLLAFILLLRRVEVVWIVLGGVIVILIYNWII